MSADLLIAALVVDEKRGIDFEAADHAVSELSEDVVDFESSVEAPGAPKGSNRSAGPCART